MITEHAVQSLYIFFNIPSHLSMESIEYIEYINLTVWRGIPFNEIQRNIQHRLNTK